jgi:hypothetical protein
LFLLAPGADASPENGYTSMARDLVPGRDEERIMGLAAKEA